MCNISVIDFTLIGQTIINTIQLVLVLTPKCCVINWEVASSNIIVFDLIQARFAPTIYHTGDKNSNHYTTHIRFVYNKNQNLTNRKSAFRWKGGIKFGKRDLYMTVGSKRGSNVLVLEKRTDKFANHVLFLFLFFNCPYMTSFVLNITLKISPYWAGG